MTTYFGFDRVELTNEFKLNSNVILPLSKKMFVYFVILFKFHPCGLS